MSRIALVPRIALVNDDVAECRVTLLNPQSQSCHPSLPRCLLARDTSRQQRSLSVPSANQRVKNSNSKPFIQKKPNQTLVLKLQTGDLSVDLAGTG